VPARHARLAWCWPDTMTHTNVMRKVECALRNKYYVEDGSEECLTLQLARSAQGVRAFALAQFRGQEKRRQRSGRDSQDSQKSVS
jgi:hypothetical protein